MISSLSSYWSRSSRWLDACAVHWRDRCHSRHRKDPFSSCRIFHRVSTRILRAPQRRISLRGLVVTCEWSFYFNACRRLQGRYQATLCVFSFGGFYWQLPWIFLSSSLHWSCPSSQRAPFSRYRLHRAPWSLYLTQTACSPYLRSVPFSPSWGSSGELFLSCFRFCPPWCHWGSSSLLIGRCRRGSVVCCAPYPCLPTSWCLWDRRPWMYQRNPANRHLSLP